MDELAEVMRETLSLSGGRVVVAVRTKESLAAIADLLAKRSGRRRAAKVQGSKAEVKATPTNTKTKVKVFRPASGTLKQIRSYQKPTKSSKGV